jgi:transcriptional regulator with XRE-family HTH domain
MGEAGFPMSQPIVANLEAGKRPTRVAEIEALANLFNVPMAQLFSAPTNGERSALEVARQAEACDEAAASFTRSLMATQRLHSALVESSERLAQAIGKAPDPDDHQVAQTVDRAHSVLSFALGIAGQFYTIGGPNSILSYQQPEESGDGEH